ncbi:hypothetical protein AVEN_80839-1 [Araneus ventricosus]|uniref:Uncharacterized protein n=1 Tax=Araneus ventricosus TaxID=182803 RepID=A0A4Y2UPB0_ARAVE|nr:hypothetical protein AVEN_2166-1 [Araneus ventricosus]GBO13377.1 hypothetical protein AVEN_80839-1 [Araneus ventricosus]
MLVTGVEWISLTNSRPCEVLVFFIYNGYHHVNLKYNDIYDCLGKEGTTMPQVNVEPLTSLELYSRRKAFVNISWRHPPAHSWYRSESPGATIHFKGRGKTK